MTRGYFVLEMKGLLHAAALMKAMGKKSLKLS